MRNGQLYEPYRHLADAYNEDDFVAEGDFAERMLKLTERIAEDFEVAGGTSVRGKNLSSGEITELVYKHDLRHTCATLLLGRGVHPKIVQELPGHATIAMTLDTYSHYLPSMGDQASGAMGDAVG